jgi:hypothetical protein
VPPYVEAVTIIADDDAAGRKGADAAAQALDRRGIGVQVLLGIGGGDDEAGR